MHSFVEFLKYVEETAATEPFDFSDFFRITKSDFFFDFFSKLKTNNQEEINSYVIPVLDYFKENKIFLKLAPNELNIFGVSSYGQFHYHPSSTHSASAITAAFESHDPALLLETLFSIFPKEDLETKSIDEIIKMNNNISEISNNNAGLIYPRIHFLRELLGSLSSSSQPSHTLQFWFEKLFFSRFSSNNKQVRDALKSDLFDYWSLVQVESNQHSCRCPMSMLLRPINFSNDAFAVVKNALFNAQIINKLLSEKEDGGFSLNVDDFVRGNLGRVGFRDFLDSVFRVVEIAKDEDEDLAKYIDLQKQNFKLILQRFENSDNFYYLEDFQNDNNRASVFEFGRGLPSEDAQRMLRCAIPFTGRIRDNENAFNSNSRTGRLTRSSDSWEPLIQGWFSRITTEENSKRIGPLILDFTEIILEAALERQKRLIENTSINDGKRELIDPLNFELYLQGKSILRTTLAPALVAYDPPFLWAVKAKYYSIIRRIALRSRVPLGQLNINQKFEEEQQKHENVFDLALIPISEHNYPLQDFVRIGAIELIEEFYGALRGTTVLAKILQGDDEGEYNAVEIARRSKQLKMERYLIEELAAKEI
jgi:hypothetical protein